MKVLLIGANGHLGKITTKDLLAKGYDVMTLTREPYREGSNVIGDPSDKALLEKLAKENDIIVSTVGAPSVDAFKKIAESVINASEKAGIPVIWSGGAGSLKDKDGKSLLDLGTASFTGEMEKFIPAVFGHAAVKEMFMKSNIDWVFVAPAATMDPTRGLKTHKTEVTDVLLYNRDGESIIGYETQAQVLTDMVKDWKEFDKKQVSTVETE